MYAPGKELTAPAWNAVAHSTEPLGKAHEEVVHVPPFNISLSPFYLPLEVVLSTTLWARLHFEEHFKGSPILAQIPKLFFLSPKKVGLKDLDIFCD